MSLINYTPIKEIYTGLVYSEEYKTIICTYCQFALGDIIDIINHLKKEHSNYINKDEILNTIKPLLKELELVKVKDIKIPKPNTIYFKDLKIHKGFKCIKCSFLSISYKAIRLHLNTSHNIKSNNTKSTDFLKEYYKSDIIIQSFSTYSRTIKYFITSNNNILNQDIIINTKSTEDLFIRNYNQDLQTIQNNIQPNIKDLTTKELSSFLINTKWHEFFINKNIKKEIQLVEKPINNSNNIDNILFLAYKLIKELTYKLEANIIKLNRWNSQRLNNEDPSNNNISNLYSFKVVETATKKEYNITFARFIIYIIRLYNKDDITTENSNNDNINNDNINNDNINNDNINTNHINNPLFNQPILEDVKEELDLITNALNYIYNLDKNTQDYNNKYNKVLDIFESNVIQLIFSLLKQNIKQQSLEYNSLFNSPIITFCILTSIDNNSLNFKEESNIQNLCSKIIYNFRLYFIGYLELLSNIQKDFNFDNSFNKYYNKYLTNQANNCFSEITQIRIYTKKIAANKIAPSRIADLDPNQIFIDNKLININKLKDFIQIGFTRLEDILYNNLLFINKEDIDIDLNNLKDNNNITNPYYYFIDFKSKEQDLLNYKQLLIKKLFNKDTLISQVLVKNIDTINSNINFNTLKVKELLLNRTKFLELLLVLIYITSGSPIRGSEVVLLKFRNSLTTGLRNIIIDQKYNFIKLNTTYSKQWNITRKDTTNIRYLCPRLSNILKAYLLLFIPLYDYLNIRVFKQTQLSNYLFENNTILYTSNRLSTILENETEQYLDAKLSLNPYRHFIIFLIKNRILLEYNSSESEEDKIEDITANHTTRTANITYAREANITFTKDASIERKSYEFNIKFFTYLNLYNNIYKSRKHKRILSTEDIQNKKLRTNINTLNRLSISPLNKRKAQRNIIESSSNDEDIIINKKNINNPSSNRNFYTILSDDANNTSKSEEDDININNTSDLEDEDININNTSDSEDEDININNTSDLEEDNIIISNNTNNSNLESKKRQKERQVNRELLDINNINNININNKLQLFFNDSNAKFKSNEQKEAIEAIINKNPIITYINGTNSGKSLLFFFNNYINPNNISFIITPRTSLKIELNNKAKDLGLKSQIYTNNININSNLIFLGLEDIINKSFQTYITTLIISKRTFTFYFDEAHLLILERDFRYILKYINTINNYIEQIVFISATLPNPLLNLLENKFNILNNTIIRGNTTRPNIRYNILELNKGETEASLLKDIIIDLNTKLNNNDRVIIFTNTKKSCEYYSLLLNIPCYYSDKKNKDEILDNFLNKKINNINTNLANPTNSTNPTKTSNNTNTLNNNKYIIATNAIGVGIDYSHIPYIIHVGIIKSFINLDQEIGRGGRNGQECYSIIIKNPNNYKGYINNNINNPDQELEKFKVLDYNKVVDLINEKVCYRRIFESYLNNKLVDNCLDDLLKCGLCTKRATIINNIQNKEIAFRKHAILAKEEIYNKLQIIINNYCFTCLLFKHDIEIFNKHNLYNCYNNLENKTYLLKKVRNIERIIKDNRKIKEGYCCLQCFLPNTICYNRDIKEEKCIYQNTILETIIFLIEFSTKYNYTLPSLERLKIQADDLLLPANLITFICKPIIYNNTDIIQGVLLLLDFDLHRIIQAKKDAIQQIKEYDISINNNTKLLLNRIKEIEDTSSFKFINLKDVYDLNYNKAEADRYNAILITNYNWTQTDINNFYLLKKTDRDNIITKINYYYTNCLFCLINNKAEVQEHITNNCPFNIKAIKDINKYYYPTSILERNYNNRNKEELYNNSKFDNNTYDSNCLLSTIFCNRFKALYKHQNRPNQRKCIINYTILALFYLIYQNRISRHIPDSYYKGSITSFFYYITTPQNYKFWEGSIALNILSQLSLSINDEVLL